LSTQWQMGHSSNCGMSFLTRDRSPCNVLSAVVSYSSSRCFKCSTWRWLEIEAKHVEQTEI